MSLYITLPCTASKSQFPDNTRGKYTTLLAQELILPGDYEAGVCEVIIPPTKRLNITKQSEIWYGNKVAADFIFRVEKEDCISFKNLTELETPKDENGIQYFYFEIERGNLKLVINKGNDVKLFGPLADMFGFHEGLKYTQSAFSLKKEYQIDIAYIYCDLCEYAMVGDAIVPCIRVIPLNNDSTTSICYDNVHYAPVDGNRFSTIEIAISDDLGRVVEFSEGITIVKLHLRPRR